MDKKKVRRFKNKQRQLAKKIAKQLGDISYSIEYEQTIPSARRDKETGKLIIGNSTQIVFPTKVMRRGKNRVIVVMRFNGKCDYDVLNKVLQRWFTLRVYGNKFEVRSLFSPNTIANC